ncbi:MAG: hypothetical protein IKT51_02665 [Phascolarctobacterium sp.]|nr:hypothetical protein [Phascolarctobacterium sp.]
MKNYGQVIHRTWDDSYVINDGLYHIPNNEEFKTQWEQVHAYALANPAMVTEEYPYVPPAPTEEEIQAQLEQGIEAWMNTVVAERHYDSIDTCIARYTDSPNPKYAQEAKAVKDWNTLVWDKCWGILAEVKAGTRPIPTLEEVIAELPKLEW